MSAIGKYTIEGSKNVRDFARIFRTSYFLFPLFAGKMASDDLDEGIALAGALSFNPSLLDL